MWIAGLIKSNEYLIESLGEKKEMGSLVVINRTRVLTMQTSVRVKMLGFALKAKPSTVRLNPGEAWHRRP